MCIQRDQDFLTANNWRCYQSHRAQTYICVSLNFLRNQVRGHNSWLHSPPQSVRSGCFAAAIDHNEEKRRHVCVVCQSNQLKRSCGYVCTRTGVSRSDIRMPSYYASGRSSCLGRKSYFQCVSCWLSCAPRSERRYFVLHVCPGREKEICGNRFGSSVRHILDDFMERNKLFSGLSNSF